MTLAHNTINSASRFARSCLLFFALTAAFTNANALSLSLGNLIITEIMANPSGVSDTQGEWFELYNASTDPIELNGLSVRDTSTAVGTLDFGGSFLLPPASYASVARSTSAGFAPDGLYDAISLNNGGDSLFIGDGTSTLASLSYGSGESIAAASTSIDLGSLQWFTDMSNAYGLGNTGSPGLANMLGSATGMDISVIPNPNVVPIPAGIWLLLSGIGMLWARQR